MKTDNPAQNGEYDAIVDIKHANRALTSDDTQILHAILFRKIKALKLTKACLILGCFMLYFPF